jgi:hypothetical protein
MISLLFLCIDFDLHSGDEMSGDERVLVNWVLNLRVPENAGELSSVKATRDLWSSSKLHRVKYYYLYNIYDTIYF